MGRKGSSLCSSAGIGAAQAGLVFLAISLWPPADEENRTASACEARVLDEFEPLAVLPSTVKLTTYQTETLTAATRTQALQQIVGGVVAGRSRVSGDRLFHFHEMVEAHRSMEERRPRSASGVTRSRSEPLRITLTLSNPLVIKAKSEQVLGVLLTFGRARLLPPTEPVRGQDWVLPLSVVDNSAFSVLFSSIGTGDVVLLVSGKQGALTFTALFHAKAALNRLPIAVPKNRRSVLRAVVSAPPERNVARTCKRDRQSPPVR
jgi:hypothetical protein